jgi:hypothetical protein
MAKRIGNPRKTTTVTELHARLVKAVAALEALPPGESDENTPRWARNIDKCMALAKAIVWSPARSALEMRVKIRAAIWDINGRLHPLGTKPLAAKRDPRSVAADYILEMLDHDLVRGRQ